MRCSWKKKDLLSFLPVHMSKKNLLIVTIIIFSAVFLCRFFLADQIYIWNSRITDTFFKIRHRIRGKEYKSPCIEMFTISDQDIDALDIALHDRNMFGKFIEILAKYRVKTILFDIIFEHYQSDMSDAHLIEWTKRAGNVIYPVSAVNREESSLQNLNDNTGQKYFWHPEIILPGKPGVLSSCITPFDELVKAAKGLGVFDYSRDTDGVARRVPLIFLSKNGYVPSIVLAAIADFFNITPGDIRISFGKMITLMQVQFPDGTVRDLSIPIDMQGRMHINFAAPYKQSFRYSPVRELLYFDEQIEEHPDFAHMLKDCLVIVSEVSSREPNNIATVFDKVAPHSEVLAHAINTILTGNYIHNTGALGFESIVFSIVFFSLLVLFFLQCKNSRFIILSGITFIFYFILVFVMFFLCNRIVVFLPDASGFACLLLFFFVNRYIILTGEKRKYKSEYEKIRKSTDQILDHLKDLEKMNSIKIDNKTLHINEKACHEFYVTPGQKKILWLLLQGYRYKDIASILHITEGTVKSQVSRLKEATNTYDRSTLVQKFFFQ